ncbi:MAG TPA: hypothetical protein VF299_07685 [Mycobacterium sp.]
MAIAWADLADGTPHNTGPDFGKASPFGLLVIVLLLLGTTFLVWSMNRQLKKIPKSFDDTDAGSAADPDDPSGPGTDVGGGR